ncbi:amidohydrolase family protein [Rhizobium leguminosarum]|uniref:amidohydrolase family protein n=1 Tax=Rhizobium leguminosarum TaxID=384 RepID=UPI0028F414A0|nr:amidohydrolase family protein [Rhizobium leguminosarum]
MESRFLHRCATPAGIKRKRRPSLSDGQRHVQPAYLRQAIDAVGVDRILFSADYPYQYRPGGDARRFVEDLELDAADRAKFAHANWERLTAGRLLA